MNLLTKKIYIMPYTYDDYPNTMKNLSPDVRKKAIDILNKLIEEKNMDSGMAIATSISKAREWASKTGRTGSDKTQGASGEIRIKSHKKGWAVQKEGSSQASFVFDTKDEAIDKGRQMARENNMDLKIYKEDGSLQEEREY
jgi:uncharacterized protein YdaT